MSRECAAPPPGPPGGGAVCVAAKARPPGCIEDACTIVNPLQLPLEYSEIIHQEHIFYAQNLFIETIKRRSERNSRVRACLCAPCPAHLSAECCNKIAGLRRLLSHGSLAFGLASQSVVRSAIVFPCTAVSGRRPHMLIHLDSGRGELIPEASGRKGEATCTNDLWQHSNKFTPTQPSLGLRDRFESSPH